VEHHGLSLPMGRKNKVKVHNMKGGVSISGKFCEKLGTLVQNNQIIQIKDIFSQIPELHEPEFSLDLLPYSKRKLLQIEIEFSVNDKINKLFSELKYPKKAKTRNNISKF
jgi:hypothetical protein